MSAVWIVTLYERGEGHTIEAVCASRAAAVAFAEPMVKGWKIYDYIDGPTWEAPSGARLRSVQRFWVSR